MKKASYPLNTIFTDDSMRLSESVLTMVLKSKVKSHSGKESLSVKDKRRIETYLPILTGEDVQMKEELLSEVSLWLLEHNECFESLYHAGNDKAEIIFYDGYFLELLQYVGNVMKSHRQNIGYQRITVNKLNNDGTIARYPLSEKDIADGRKIGRPMKKEYVTISRLDIVTNEGVKTLDSESYTMYLRELKLDEHSQEELKRFLTELSNKVPQEHFITWFRYYTSEVSKRNVALKNLANNFNVTLSTLYRWKDRVNKVVAKMKAGKALKNTIGYNTNYISSVGNGKRLSNPYVVKGLSEKAEYALEVSRMNRICLEQYGYENDWDWKEPELLKDDKKIYTLDIWKEYELYCTASYKNKYGANVSWKERKENIFFN